MPFLIDEIELLQKGDKNAVETYMSALHEHNII